VAVNRFTSGFRDTSSHRLQPS